MKVKVTITKVFDDADFINEMARDFTPEDLPDAIVEFLQEDIDEALMDAIWAIEIDPVEPEWLDQPNREGWWAYVDNTTGYSSVMSVEFGPDTWCRDPIHSCPTIALNGQWRRLHIHWPEASE